MSGLRLAQLRLEPWGCFENLKLDFGPSGVVDLVLGPNAAGKSTMTRGILGLLFGIEQRTRDGHTFDYQDLRIGAKLSTDEGSADLVRRKGRTGTLADPSGEPLPDDAIAEALGGLSREIFESLLLVDNAALKAGGAELLQGKGEVGASLFAAAAGIATLHTTIEGLDDAAREIFNPKGRKDDIHNALRDLKAAEKRLRDATFRPQRHREMERDLRRLDRESEEIAAEIQALLIERSELDRRRKVAPLARRHVEVRERLDRLSGTPDLPEDAREHRTTAELHRSLAGEALTKARGKREKLTVDIEARDVDAGLMARSEEIQAAMAGLSAVIKGAEDKPRLEGEVLVAKEKVSEAADAVGADVGDIEGLARPTTVQGELDDAVQENGLLVERLRAALEAEELAGQELATTERELARAPVVIDWAGLDAAARAARRLGPIDRQLTETRAEIGRLVEVGELTLSRMFPRPGSLPDLETLVPPAKGTVESWLVGHADLEQEARDLKVAEERLRAESHKLDALQDELEFGRSVPGPEALSAARDVRDRSWREIRSSFENGAPPVLEQMDDYEGRAEQADSIVDEQLTGSTELERATRIEVDRRSVAREQEALAGKAREIQEASLEERRTWSELWASAGCGVPAPTAALDWLKQLDDVLGLAQSRSRLETKAKILEGEIASHRHALEDRLCPFGVEPGDRSLGEVLEIAEAKITSSESAARQREEIQAAAMTAKQVALKAKDDAAEAERALAGWKEGWPAILDAVGLPPPTTPEAALKISRTVGEGLEQLRKQRELERRIAGIDRDRADYADRVERLLAEVASDLDGAAPETAASLLGRRLKEGETEAAAREVLLSQQASVDEEVTLAENAVVVADEEIAAVLASAECNDLDQLPDIEERSGEARGLRREAGDLERQVVEIGVGRFDDLALEIQDFDPAVAAARLTEIERLVTDLTEKRDDHKQELGARKAELRSAELDVAAVTAREDMELIKGELKILAKDYALARLGSVVVRRAMERYRRMHENPLLERANELFARITLGDFVELLVDHHEHDGAILVGRQRDRKLKRVEEMSSGTREQLFLSLRIAAIERFVATSRPVPIIFDDAFLESDDDRSEKIFESLGELARTTQVIVLTHRRQQAALGERVLGSGLATVELDGTVPFLRAAA